MTGLYSGVIYRLWFKLIDENELAIQQNVGIIRKKCQFIKINIYFEFCSYRQQSVSKRLKEEVANTVTDCQKQMEIDQATERLLHDDQSSINSNGPHHRRQSLSSTSFCSSRKEKLRVVLIARKKLELAKTRAS